MANMEQARYTQLVALEKRLDLIQERAEARQDEEHDYSKHLISLFQDICKIVRDADNSTPRLTTGSAYAHKGLAASPNRLNPKERF